MNSTNEAVRFTLTRQNCPQSGAQEYGAHEYVNVRDFVCVDPLSYVYSMQCEDGRCALQQPSRTLRIHSCANHIQ